MVSIEKPALLPFNSIDRRNTNRVIPSHGLRFKDTRFWVQHRRREYGPFDYEWSKDLDGIELMYRGSKFGEYCSEDEIFADLKEFKLPRRVVEVASVVLGCILFGMLNGLAGAKREVLMVDHLTENGLERFAQFDFDSDAA